MFYTSVRMKSLPLTIKTLPPQSQNLKQEVTWQVEQITCEDRLHIWCSWSEPVFKRTGDQFSGLFPCSKNSFHMPLNLLNSRIKWAQGGGHKCENNLSFRQTLSRLKSSRQSRADQISFHASLFFINALKSRGVRSNYMYEKSFKKKFSYNCWCLLNERQ